MLKVLLTGHDGYIGPIMRQVFLAAGFEVTGLDIGLFSACTLGPEPKTVKSLAIDVRDVTVADLSGFDAVVHYAALSNDPLGSMNPELTRQINLEGSVRLARLSRDAGVKRFVFASSCSMYGAGEGSALLTEESPLQPLTPYAVAKVDGERRLNQLLSDEFSVVSMRNATVYGFSPRLRADIVLNNFVCWATTTGTMRILSDGTPWRPLVHVEDLARTAVELLKAPRELVHGEAFNVGFEGENYQVRDLVAVVRDTVPESQSEFVPRGAVDARNYRVDFSKLKRTFPHLEPRWDARLGAREMYEMFRETKLTREDFEGGKFTRLSRLEHLLKQGAVDSSLRWTPGSGPEQA